MGLWGWLGEAGRRTAASGVSAPAGGIVHAGCAPHFLFETSKRKCAAPGGKEKMFGANLHIRASLLKYEGRREMVPADLREPPNGRGGVRCGFDSGFPRRGCRRQRGARTHLTSSSFRAFRSATRCPGGRGGCTGGRMRASAPTLGVAHLHGPTHRSAPAKHTRPSASP